MRKRGAKKTDSQSDAEATPLARATMCQGADLGVRMPSFI
jgi:hypothetical protein